MFSGIIENTGQIESISGSFFEISAPFSADLKIGESVAINGVCTTVLGQNSKTFRVEIMQISREKTSFKSAKVGNLVNLERAARFSDRNSGHLVQGHVDSAVRILARKKGADFELFEIERPADSAGMLVECGSVALDGISLTIAKLHENSFEISVLAHTEKNTNLQEKSPGDWLNLEYDILAKYVAAQLEARAN